MEFAEFHNALRILLNIDQPEFDDTLGPSAKLQHNIGWAARKWIKFRDDPHRYFIQCDDDQAAKLFAIIQERSKP